MACCSCWVRIVGCCCALFERMRDRKAGLASTDFFIEKFGVKSIRDNQHGRTTIVYLQASIMSQALIFDQWNWIRMGSNHMDLHNHYISLSCCS
ncbi:hypothetical protein RDI58_004215 [Solanum bulbocastanum]|uniref:Uncharacterized protein n=1 Tax=Solanum bulbocastanum TaxID=147425 RepID=A0AAN8U0X6_SOLBU